MSLALGGLFFAALQWITAAMWSAPVRRVAESFTSYLPFIFLTFAGIFLASHSLYHWTHTEDVLKDPILYGKMAYLNLPFFGIRNVVAIILWIVFAKIMVGNSLKQDSVGGQTLTEKNKSLTPAFIIVFALTYSMASFDQMMSLDPHWFSTMFGVYCFAGLIYSTFAVLAILIVRLRENGHFAKLINDNHYHDIGKFMFGFAIFWAYIGFSQFMLIWYANLPEETPYMIRRMTGPWLPVSIAVLVLKFVLPFLILLPRANKRNPRILVGVACLMLVAQWLDMAWLVQPEFFGGLVVGWVEVGTTIGFIGVFGLFVARFLAKHNSVAIGDPRLAESVFHHHQ
jgi:hypothetical protein